MAEINKCPACGAMRTSFAAVCPECGYEFPQVAESSSVQKFAEKITELDQSLNYYDDDSSSFGFWTVIGWLVVFPIMAALLILRIVKMNNKNLVGNEKIKANAISMFPILNSRNDLIESALLFESQIKPLSYFAMLTESGTSVQRWNRVWLDKFSQIVKKSEISLKGDNESLKQIHTSFNNAKAIVEKNKKNMMIALGGLTGIFVIILIIASI